MSKQEEKLRSSNSNSNSNAEVSTSGQRLHFASTFPGGSHTEDNSEDAYDIGSCSSGQITLYMVADGHGGPEGRHAAQLACHESLLWTVRYAAMFPQWFKAGALDRQIDMLFASIHNKFRTEMHTRTRGSIITPQGRVVSSYGVPVRGGTTLTCVWVFTYEGMRIIHTANVGDSEAMLIRLSGGDASRPRHTLLTTEHSPSNQNEYRRVMLDFIKPMWMVYDLPQQSDKCRCPLIYKPIPADEATDVKSDLRHQQYVTDPWGNGLSPKNIRYDPAVYAVAPCGGHAIAVTRALGDFNMHEYGMISLPSHNVEHLEPDESCMICIASDGLWDCWTYADFAQYMTARMGDVNSTIQSVVTHAMDATKTVAVANFGRGYDDTTLVAVHLSPLTDSL